MVKVYLEADEVERLEQAAEYTRDRLLIRLLFHLGCRISEALGIAVSDIDFAGGTVTIQHLKARLKLSCPDCDAGLSRSSRFCPKCGHEVDRVISREMEHRRQRIIPVDGDALKMLEEYVARGGAVHKNGKELLFGINRHRGWQIVTACAERAGLPSLLNPESGRVHHVSPHRLRDAFAIHALKVNDSGEGQRLLQEMLGHQSFNTTARYRKVAGEELNSWYAKLWEKQNVGTGDSNHRP